MGRWLRFAREALSTAPALIEQNKPARQAFFHAQQAAEKEVKAALLIFLQVDFPYRHDLDYLRALLPGGWLLKEAPPDLAELTVWTIRGRYPGDLQDATEEQAQTAAEQTREVVRTSSEDLERYGYEAETEEERAEPAEEDDE